MLVLMPQTAVLPEIGPASGTPAPEGTSCLCSSVWPECVAGRTHATYTTATANCPLPPSVQKSWWVFLREYGFTLILPEQAVEAWGKDRTHPRRLLWQSGLSELTQCLPHPAPRFPRNLPDVALNRAWATVLYTCSHRRASKARVSVKACQRCESRDRVPGLWWVQSHFQVVEKSPMSWVGTDLYQLRVDSYACLF